MNHYRKASDQKTSPAPSSKGTPKAKNRPEPVLVSSGVLRSSASPRATAQNPPTRSRGNSGGGATAGAASPALVKASAATAKASGPGSASTSSSAAAPPLAEALSPVSPSARKAPWANLAAASQTKQVPFDSHPPSSSSVPGSSPHPDPGSLDSGQLKDSLDTSGQRPSVLEDVDPDGGALSNGGQSHVSSVIKQDERGEPPSEAVDSPAGPEGGADTNNSEMAGSKLETLDEVSVRQSDQTAVYPTASNSESASGLLVPEPKAASYPDATDDKEERNDEDGEDSEGDATALNNPYGALLAPDDIAEADGTARQRSSDETSSAPAPTPLSAAELASRALKMLCEGGLEDIVPPRKSATSHRPTGGPLTSEASTATGGSDSTSRKPSGGGGAAAASGRRGDASSRLQPRGLVNTGNSCFINSTLQVIEVGSWD